MFVRVLDIDEDTAFDLAIALNMGRRQLGPEQIAALHERLAEDKERRKVVAAELRAAGRTQKEVAAVVGVSRRTVGDWEKERNGSFAIPCPRDLRISVPKTEKPHIYERLQAGYTVLSTEEVKLGPRGLRALLEDLARIGGEEE